MEAPTTKIKYFLAKSWKRILARFFDLLLLSGIIVAFYAIFFFINKKDYLDVNLFLGWTFVVWIINTIYFILIPFFFKGRTLFLLAFGLRYVDLKLNDYYFSNKIYLYKLKHQEKSVKDNRDKINYFINLIRREITTSQVFSYILIILGITACSLGQEQGENFIKYLVALILNANDKDIYNNAYYSAQFASVYIGLYSILSFWIIVIFINTIINSESRNIIDKISGVITIDLKSNGEDSSKNTKQQSKIQKQYELPGEIVGEALKEITE